MNTKKWLLVAGLALLLVNPAFAVDDEEYEAPKDDETIEFKTGYRGADTDGALFRVAEYAYTDSTPVVGVAWSTSPYANTLIDLYIKRIADVDYDAKASFDMDRKVRVDVEATGLLHRLGHDPLNNLNAVSEIKVVNQTDNDPTAQYGINYSNLKIGSEFQHPDLSWLTWRIGVRQQRREGTRQQLASGHCTSCHVTSNTREVNQKQQEFTFGAHATTGGVDIDYEFLGRDFEDQAATVLAQYDVAYRPETPVTVPDYENVLITPFQDRVWFQDGLFPVNQVPQLRRSQHKLKARGKLNDANVVNFTVVRSDTKNRLTGLDYEYTGFRGRYTWRASEKFRLNFYGHWDQLDSSQYYVDMPTIVGNPAPTQGYPGGIGVTTFQDFLNDWALPSRADPTIGPQNFNNWDRLSIDGPPEGQAGLRRLLPSWKQARLASGLLLPGHRPRQHGAGRRQRKDDLAERQAGLQLPRQQETALEQPLDIQDGGQPVRQRQRRPAPGRHGGPGLLAGSPRRGGSSRPTVAAVHRDAGAPRGQPGQHAQQAVQVPQSDHLVA